MANDKDKRPVKSEEGTTTAGGGSFSTHAVGYILGFSDTQNDNGLPVDNGSPIFDEKGQRILAKVSVKQMGNKQKQARKGEDRVVFDKFGHKSSQQAIKENLIHSEKDPKKILANVLGLMRGNLPKPRGPS